MMDELIIREWKGRMGKAIEEFNVKTEIDISNNNSNLIKQLSKNYIS